jgi:nitrous oxide reductase accessory protein NosL
MLDRKCRVRSPDAPKNDKGPFGERALPETYMKRFGIGILIIFLAASFSWAGEKKPIKPSPKDKCPVCGMFVAKYPDFFAEIIYKDGTYAVFDGAKDMFKYFFNLRKYHPSQKTENIDAIYVTDYYNLTLIDGYEATYVIGSDIYGPMGREPIPFAKEADAQEFRKDHKGKSLLRFKEITTEIIKSLD